jgi:hypothetical protein
MGKNDPITIPVKDLVIFHAEIGVHRGRKYGFRDVFEYGTLFNLPFIKLAKRVKAAYTGEAVPSHKGWPAQREALRWLVEKGAASMYDFGDHIQVMVRPSGGYYISEGNHRSLALYILGAESVRAVVIRAPSFMGTRRFGH